MGYSIELHLERKWGIPLAHCGNQQQVGYPFGDCGSRFWKSQTYIYERKDAKSQRMQLYEKEMILACLGSMAQPFYWRG
jgi:hypothetical protein